MFGVKKSWREGRSLPAIYSQLSEMKKRFGIMLRVQELLCRFWLRLSRHRWLRLGARSQQAA
jgi:hypothetical protein